MITVRDLAAKVGVSVSTIGRAMADDPRISAETKAKVKKAANQAGYVGSLPARVMRGAASNLIGLLLPDVRNDFYAEIAQALSQTCDREGHRLVLSITGDDRDVEARNVRELVAARASGVIIVPTASPRRETLKMLESLAHVQLLRKLRPLGDNWFGIDDEPALYEATLHLLKLGHTRIAYMGGQEVLSTGAARVAGFRRAYKSAGISPKLAIECLGATTSDYGRAATADLLTRAEKPTAIITGSVHVTFGAVEAIERANIAVPGRLSFVGFGDPSWFEWWRGGLTTVRPPVQELATMCGLWFLNSLKTRGASTSTPPHTAIAHSTLILRSTTQRIDSNGGKLKDGK